MPGKQAVNGTEAVVNGTASASERLLKFDPDDPEYIKELQRPAVIKVGFVFNLKYEKHALTFYFVFTFMLFGRQISSSASLDKAAGGVARVLDNVFPKPSSEKTEDLRIDNFVLI